MEQLFTNLLSQFPNFAVALVMLWWQKVTIEKLLETQTKLIDRLLTYVDNDKLRAAALVHAQTAAGANKDERAG